MAETKIEESNSQAWLLEKIRSLGYPLTSSGCCFGVSYMALQASLIGEFEHFKQRNALIRSIPTENFPDYINTLEKKRRDKMEPLTEEELMGLEIPAFFEGICIYHEPWKFAELFHEKPQRIQNKLLSEPLTRSQKLEETGGMVAAEAVSGIYSKQQLEMYFSCIKKAMLATKMKEPLNLVLISSGHAILVKIDPDEKMQAQVFNVNQTDLPPLAIMDLTNISELAEQVYCSLKLQFYQAPPMKPVIIYDDGPISALIMAELLNQMKVEESANSSEEENDYFFDPGYFSSFINPPPSIETPEPEPKIGYSEESASIEATENGFFFDNNFISNDTNHLTPDNIVIFATEMYSTNQNKAILEKFYDALKQDPEWIKIHEITPEKVKLADNKGASWLELAGQMNYMELTKTLFEAGADPNLQSNGISAFYRIVQKNNLELARIMLLHHADPNLSANNGATPLILAVVGNYPEMLKLLLSFKADPNQEYKNIPPLFLAAQHGLTDIVKILLEQNSMKINCKFVNTIDGLNQFAKDNHVEQAMAAFIQQKNPESNLQEIALTASEIATIMGHHEIAALIIEAETKKSSLLCESIFARPKVQPSAGEALDDDAQTDLDKRGAANPFRGSD